MPYSWKPLRCCGSSSEKMVATVSRTGFEAPNGVVASRLIRVESERALIRLALDFPRRQKEILQIERELKHLWPKADFIEITREICDRAGRISPRSRLRSLNTIHLATFFRLKELDPAIEMLTCDERIEGEL